MAENQLKNETLRYLGRELPTKNSTGTNQHGEWKRFKLKFDCGGQYPRTFTCFFPIRSDKSDVHNPEDLVEGNFYRIVFKSEPYTHPEHGKNESRTAVLLCNATEAEKTTFSSGGTASAPKPASIFNQQIWDEFTKAFDEKTKGSTDVNYVQMIGAYVTNCAKTECADLIAAAKKHFEKPVPQKEELVV